MKRPGKYLVILGWLAAVACGDDTTAAGGAGGLAQGTGGAGAGANTGGEPGLGAAGGAGGAGGIDGGGGAGGSFEGVDPLLGVAAPVLVEGGFEFTEGPVWLPALSVLRFSDIPANEIRELDADGSAVWRSNSGGTNGNGLAPDGDIVMCEGGARRVSRSAADGAPAPVLVAAEYEGLQLNSPNDVIIRSDGTIYFTDPTYGLGGGTQELDFQGAFRVTLAGDVELVGDAFEQPNGIALSPDETVLYVSDSQAGGLYAYDVAPDGSTSGGKLLIDASPSDGMAVDDAGNLYLTTSAGVEVYRPDGSAWGTLAVPEHPANCTFGGPDRRTLFITARTGLYRVELNVPGKP